jgi:hypothetical protein
LEVDQFSNCADCVVIAFERLLVFAIVELLSEYEFYRFDNLLGVRELGTSASVFS